MLTREECCDFLRQHDDYLILTHIRPDGDTLGCGSALCGALQTLFSRVLQWRSSSGGTSSWSETYFPFFLR